MTTNQAQQNINKLFDEYLDNVDENESPDEMIEALDEVIYKALLEMLGYSNSDATQKKLVRKKMYEFMMSMDFNSPVLANSEKIIRAMGVKNFSRATEYLVKLYELRAKQLSKVQSVIAQQPRKIDPLSKTLSRILKINPSISANDAISALESGQYSDVITDYDDDSISYISNNGIERSVNKSSIPSRLSRLRKK
jgi:hypothetical protein